MRKNVLILGHNDATQFIDIYNQYTRLFDPEKYLVTVAYLSGKENSTTRERTIAENIVFLQMPKRKIRGMKIAAIQKLLTLTKQMQFEIVICHRYKPSYIMLWVARFVNIPKLVCVFHELRGMNSFARRMLMRILWRPNIYLAGVSNAVRDDLRQALPSLPKENVITLYNVIDTELTEPDILDKSAARTALHLSEDDFIFGSIGRLARNKDQATLIQAFAIIKAYCPRAKLIILGDGELEAQLEAQITANQLQHDVILTGFVPNAVRYIKAFDVFVLSSIQEAFGRVLIEAMLAKRPIIATAVNGIPEVMGDTGVLVAPRNAITLAEAMQTLYKASDDDRAAIAEKAYQHMLIHYSIPAFQKQFWEEIDHAHRLHHHV